MLLFINLLAIACGPSTPAQDYTQEMVNVWWQIENNAILESYFEGCFQLKEWSEEDWERYYYNDKFDSRRWVLQHLSAPSLETYKWGDWDYGEQANSFELLWPDSSALLYATPQDQCWHVDVNYLGLWAEGNACP